MAVKGEIRRQLQHGLRLMLRQWKRISRERRRSFQPDFRRPRAADGPCTSTAAP
ncbi:hypothetical protein HMPREF3038_00466 [Akkermansia sp. KLE1797]|nr:hypothetical protein HMPREF3038_00466 [Akkermansia sp. KLE1797]KZA05452.1 hypothetical protein HMPREF1326_00859 [Akkermansia sp. KLE1605]